MRAPRHTELSNVECIEDRLMLSATIGNNLSVGHQLQNYRLAIAATAEYTTLLGGQAAALTAIETLVSDVNEIFEQELSIRFDLVSDINTIFTNSTTDGYTNGNTSQMLGVNTGILDSVLGNASYDIGHVFGTQGSGGSGLGGLAVVNSTTRKGEGASVSSNPQGAGFLSLVAHELAHQFGAEHTFNANAFASAVGNRDGDNAYEPASGSTLMSYAGISGADNLQDDPDNYLHAASFEQVQTFIAGAGSPNSTTATGNNIPTVTGGSDFTIPAGTPFELTAVGTDADIGDTLTYTWEQLDLGPAMSLPLSDNGSSPLFRSFKPSTDSTRVFPQLNDLVNNVNTAAIGEVLPATNRDLNFRTTVRDGNNGVNSDDVLLTVVNTGTPFAVTAPNAAVNWTGGLSQTVTWDVAGTTANGINVADVAIDLSLDGGLTYPFTLESSTANDGSHTLNAPNIDTTEARVRVRGLGNVFFDISDFNFSIVANAGAPGVTVVESGGNTSVSEDGVVGGAGVDTYTLALNTAPSGNVEITVNGGAQTEVSLDGSSFSSSVVVTAADTSTQTIFVRGFDDTDLEGIHSATITQMVTATSDANYPMGMAINPVTVNIADDELQPVVGVDFDQTGSTSTPENWTKVSQTFGGTTSGLLREDGVTTGIGLTLDVSGSAGLNPSAPNDTPLHSPPLDGLDGNHLASESLTLTWTGLTAGSDYNIYLLTSENFGSNVLQNISVTAGVTVPDFTQDTAPVGNGLLVNTGLANSGKTLEADALMVQADANGEIRIVVTDASAGGAGNALLSGAAIQEVGPNTIGYRVIQSSNSTIVNEAGTVDTFDVVLTSQPAGNVVINISSSDTDEATVGPTTLTFTNADWNSPQTVTVTGVDDALTDGGQTSTVTMSIDTGLTLDNNFDAVADRLLTVVTQDNEASPLVGVDFDSSGAAPTNWTSVTDTFGSTTNNLDNEDGDQTAFDLTVAVSGGANVANTSSPANLPDHTTSLANISGLRFASGALTLTWSDLTPATEYDLWLFSAWPFGNPVAQIVTINGGGANPSPFNMNVSAAAGSLLVNDTVASSARNLQDDAVRATANASGQIQIVVSNAGGDFVALSGAAIQEVVAAPVLLDFGDAPTAAQSGFAGSYPVTLADSGARHAISGATLGTQRDSEVDGLPSTNADSDDITGGIDDEDGVTFATALAVSSTTSVTGSVDIDLQNPAATNLLDAWIDFNQDGDWDDPGEQIFTNENLGTTAGIQTLNFTIPQDTGSNVTFGTTYARFRVSVDGNLLPTGEAPDGEVEDHAVTIIPSSPLVVEVNAASISEADGNAATTVTITRGTDTTNSLDVVLTSSDSTEATIQTTATIPAGQISVTVDLDAVDDTAGDGTQTVTITASASDGFLVQGSTGLDSSFGTSGKQTTQLETLIQPPHGVIATLPDGKILAVSEESGDFELTIVRHNADGTVDTSFGTGGTVVATVGSGNPSLVPTDPIPTAIKIAPDGKFYVGGVYADGVQTPFLARFNPDGSLDASFGTGGVSDLTSVGFVSVEAMDLTSDGKLIVALSSTNASPFRAMRINPDGQLDASFGSLGIVDFSDVLTEAIAVASLPDGNFLLLEESGQIVRGDRFGRLDPTFGTNGVAFVPFSSATKTFNSLVVDQSGRINIAGTALESFERDFTVSRFTADGVIDPAFDSDGSATIDVLGSQNDFVTSLELGLDGKLFVVGYTTPAASNRAAIVRLKEDGSPDSTFNGTGRLTTTLGNETDQLTLGSALTPDGSLVVLGGNDSDVRIARINSGVIPFVGSDDVNVTDNDGSANFDFGDAPTSTQSGFVGTYPVTTADSGASHDVTANGPMFGFLAEAEVNGANSAGAASDDGNGSDDEDGVFFRDVIIASAIGAGTGNVIVELQNADSVSNRLDAWIDFNRDGDWNDPGEQIFSSFDLGTSDGGQVLSFAIPQDLGSNVVNGNSYARFRVSTTGGLGVTGSASNGEVEDHEVTIVSADPFVVDTLIDESDGDYSPGDLSLREAIELANARTGADEIEFASGLTGTITLTIDQLEVNDDLTITGPGSSDLTVSGDDAFRVFESLGGTALTLEGLTITDGRPDTPTGANSGGGIFAVGDLELRDVVVTGNTTQGTIADGGGIFHSNGTLNIIDSVVSDNTTTTASAQGGGIRSFTSTVLVQRSVIDNNTMTGASSVGVGIIVIGGSLTVEQSTISDNSSTAASVIGGGVTVGGGNLTITDSTISGNSVTGSGAGIAFDGGGSTATVTNSTISGNVTAASGGGIAAFSGTFNLLHSTVTLNTAPAGQGSGLASFNGDPTIVTSSIISDNTNSDVDNISGASITSGNFNLIGTGNAATAFNLGADQAGVSAGLGPLANNGGPTFTHALLAGSLAINAGDTTSSQATDQRGTGFARVVGGSVDVGAFEVQSTIPTITASPLTKVYDGTALPVSSTADDGAGGLAADTDQGHFTFTYYAAAGLTGGVIAAPTDVGTYSVDVAYAGNADYSSVASTAFDFTITPKALTATGAAANKVYDATTAATVTITLAGVISGDTVTGSAAGTFDDKNVGTGKTVNVGSVTLAGADAGNYTVGAAGSTTADITAFALTATATAADKVYDSTDNTAVTITLATVFAGDTVTGSASGTFDDKNVGTGKTVNVGSVTLAGADAGNYSVGAAASTTADITAFALTATATAADKVYDSTDDAAVTIALATVFAGDTVTGSASGTFDDKNVGTDKTVNVGSVTLAGADAGNYTVGAAASTTADITAFALTATATAADKVYDSTDDATVTIALATVFAGDTVTGSASGTFDDKNVGTGKTVNVGSVTLAGADAGNYTVGGAVSTTADITPFALTATATAANKVYDSTDNAAVTIALATVFAGDTVTGSAAGAFDDRNVGTGKTVTVGSVTLAGTDAGNYTVGSAASAIADITPFALTATATAANKVYDSTNNAAITIALATIFAGDTVTGSASGTFEDKNVGTGKTVTVGSVTLAGTDAGNYTVGGAASTTADITAFALTATATAANKVYDSTNNAAITIALATIFAGDTVTGSASGTFDDKNVGTGKSVTVGSVTLAGADAGNYTVGMAASTTADITAFALTATATAADKVYDSNDNAAVTIGLATIFAGDTVTGSASGTFDDKNVGTGKTVTVGSVTLAGTDAENYTVGGAASTTADITAFALTATATAANKVYDSTDNAAVTITLATVFAGDTVTATAAGTFDDKNVGTGKTVSVGSVTLAGADAGNYTVGAAGSTTADITAFALTATATAADRVYDSTDDAAVTITLATVFAGDTVTGSAAGTFDDKNAGTDKAVNVGAVTLAGTDAGNYTVGAAASTTADITAFALTATATAADKVYDSTDAAAVTITLATVFAGDTVTGSASGTFDDKNVGTGKTVNVGSVTLAGADAGNYSVGAAASTTADITAFALTATATAADKVYDSTDDAAVTIALATVFAGDTVTGSAAGAFDDRNVGTDKAVNVGAVTLAGADAGNYTVGAAASTTADITAFALTATATAADKVYDSTDDAAVTIALATVFAGDTVTGSAAGTFDDKNVGTDKTVNVGSVTLAGADAGNYTVGAAASTTADITAFALTATATAADKVYDSTDNTAVTITLATVFAGDTVTGSASGTFDDKNVGTGKTVNVGSVTLAGADAGNYSVGAAAGTTADITAAALTVTAIAASKEFGNADPTLTFNAAGFVGGETATTALTGALTREVGEAVGVYQIQQGSLAAVSENYVITFVPANFTITALATPTVTLTANDAIYTALVYAGASVTVTGGTAPVNPPNVVLEYFNSNDPIAANAIAAPTDVGTYWVRAFYAGNANNNPVTTSLLDFDVTPVALTAAATADDKIYDATTAATVNVTLTGVIAGDTVTGSASGTFSDRNVGTGKAVNVGSVTLAGADAGNYTVGAAASTTADITAFALTATATAADKVYDSTDAAAVTITLATVFAGDTVTGSASGTFDDKNVGTGKTVNVGSVTLAGADAGNYTVGAAGSTTADITAFALTATTTAADRVYDSTDDAAVTITLATVFAGDTVTGSASGTFDDKNVGTGKTVSVGSVTLAGADAGNYTVGAAGSTTADITAFALTATATAADKVYDSTDDATVTIALATVFAGDTVTGSAAGTFDDKNVGTDKTVSIGSVTLAGTDAGNYTVGAAASTTADITAFALTATATAADKVYDSTDNAAVTIALATVFAGDTITGSAAGTFDDKNVGTGKTVNVGSVTLAGADAGNYTVGAAASTTADITAFALTATATAADKVYDSTDDAAVTIALATVFAGDTVTGSAAGTFDNKNVGTGKTVSVGAVTLAGADAGNYSVGAAGSTTADITAFALTATATAADKVYDSTDDAAVTIALATVFAGDTVTGSAAGTFDDKNVGTDKAVNVGAVTLAGADAGNYTVGAAASTTADITAFALTATATAADKVYDSTDNAAVTIALATVFAGDTVTGSAAGTFDDKNAGADKTVAVGAVTLAGADAGNYNVGTAASTTADITAAALTVTAIAASKEFGNADPTLTFNAAGFAGGEAATTALTGALTREVGESVGVYQIQQGSLAAVSENYVITFVPADFTITALATPTVTLTANDAIYTALVYAGASVTVTGGTAPVNPPNVVLEYFNSNDPIAANAIAAPTDVGTYWVRAFYAGNTNNNPVTTSLLDFDITPVALTAAGTVANKVYDANTDATVSVSLNGVIAGDTVTGSAAGTFDNKNVGTDKTVNVGSVILAGADAGNYTVGAAASTTADITAFALTATATAADKVYDSTDDATVTIALATVFAGDTVTGSAAGTFSDENVGTGKTVNVGSVTLAGADAGNYTVGAAASTTADITAAALTVTAIAARKEFGNADPTLTFVASGFVGGETETTALTGALSRQPGEAVGNYEILQGTLAAVNGNYAIAFVGANFAITAAGPVASLADVTFYNQDAALEDALSQNQTGQRSIIRHVEVVLDGIVNIPLGAVSGGTFNLVNQGSGGAIGLNVDSVDHSGGQTTVVILFTSGIDAIGSLLDGNYRLSINGGALFDADGSGTVGGQRVIDFHRMFGDSDGDRDVDSRDLRNYILGFRGNGFWNSVFDSDDDGSLRSGRRPDFDDKVAFFSNFGKRLNPFGS